MINRPVTSHERKRTSGPDVGRWGNYTVYPADMLMSTSTLTPFQLLRLLWKGSLYLLHPYSTCTPMLDSRHLLQLRCLFICYRKLLAPGSNKAFPIRNQSQIVENV